MLMVHIRCNHGHAQRSADHVCARLAKHSFGGRIDVDDLPIMVYRDDGIKRRVEDCGAPSLVLAQGRLSPLALEDFLLCALALSQFARITESQRDLLRQEW